ncbi:MAG: iturin A synthetase C, partial [Cyanobacteria bacterium]|nr:iturin A synthetase C [Cyanobacteriota bacterium]
GRADSMVKTRGYRVEIGEVESALSSISGISELAVVARPHEKYGNSLHAFVSCHPDGPTADEIGKQLSTIIPSYMMPYDIVSLDALPKTSTGKIDRVSLRERSYAKEGQL